MYGTASQSLHIARHLRIKIYDFKSLVITKLIPSMTKTHDPINTMIIFTMFHVLYLGTCINLNT